MSTKGIKENSPDSASSMPNRIELTPEDVLAAMREIPSYLDISVNDFLLLYEHALQHAIKRP